MTRGKETVSHATVKFDAVWDHPAGVEEDLPLAEERALETARLVRVTEEEKSGESGAGEAVDLPELLRGELLVGEASGGGNSEGWWRVETIFREI
jgi:hypothetical protein